MTRISEISTNPAPAADSQIEIETVGGVSGHPTLAAALAALAPTFGSPLTVTAAASAQVMIEAGTSLNVLLMESARDGAGVLISNLVYQWEGTIVASIRCYGGDDNTNKDEADLVFFTAEAGIEAERMRIHQEGNVEIAGDLDVGGFVAVADGMAAPGAGTGKARIYVDTADGNLKVVFASGTVKTLATDP